MYYKVQEMKNNFIAIDIIYVDVLHGVIIRNVTYL